jgi:hypothetical protein
MNADKVKLEIYIARPPTSKCREVIAVMEEVVRRYPDQVRLVIFERGRKEHPEEPSRALKYAIHKGGTVPLSFAGGKLVVGGKVPTLDAVIRGMEKAIAERDTGERHGE